MIGDIPMPVDFKYQALFLQGRPKHRKNDSFWMRHPPMNIQKRAKLFAPFDALKGFHEEIEKKEVLYSPRRILSKEEREIINRRLAELQAETVNSRIAKANRPSATVYYFVPCTDPDHEWYSRGGQYKHITGTVQKVDTNISKMMVIENKNIPLIDIVEIILEDDTDEPYFQLQEHSL